jgi:hypothetical protein
MSYVSEMDSGNSPVVSIYVSIVDEVSLASTSNQWIETLSSVRQL